MKLRGLLALCVIAALIAPAPVTASGWPTPAAGESASGDIEVLFTFDDGPNPKTTPAVLDILKKHDIKAVFFLVGEMAGSQNKAVPKLVERILAEGHVIANHTQRHKDLCRVKTEEAAVEDIDRGRETIEKVAGIELGWFRAPFGVRCERLDRLLAERKLKHFHWDLDPQEWKHNDAQKTTSYVTGSLARSSRRNVLLVHDIKKATVTSLPQILEWIDTENKSRREAGKRPIRILQAPAYAAEQLPEGLAAWSIDAKTRVVGFRTALASVLP